MDGKRTIAPGIEIIPGVSSSRPCIAGTGIIARVVCGRFRAGESASFIADDFEIQVWQVESALRFFLNRGEDD